MITISAVSLVILILLFFTVNTVRRVKSPVRLGTLLLLRYLSVILILVVLFHPGISVNRLKDNEKRVTIFLDNSKSMSFFNSENAYSGLRKIISSMPDSLTGSTEILLFGDSLRYASDKEPPLFSDEHSYFPEPPEFDISGMPVFFISDGNLQGKIPAYLKRGHNIHYIPLELTHRNSFFHISPEDDPDPVPADSVSTLRVLLKGVAEENGSITFFTDTLNSENTLGSAEIDSGYFNRTLDIKINASEPGIRKFTLYSAFNDSILDCETEFIQTTKPAEYDVYIVSDSPDLDSRALILALNREQIYNRTSSKGDADLLILHNTQDIEQHSRNIPEPSSVLITGPPPFSSEALEFGNRTFSPKISYNYHRIGRYFRDKNIRPPDLLYSPKKGISSDTIISARVTEDSETQPLLFRADYMKKKMFFLPAKGFWKWDLIPPGDKTGSFFTSIMLDIMSEEYDRKVISEKLVSYIPSSPVFSGDSIPIKLSVISPFLHKRPDSVVVSVTDTSGERLKSIRLSDDIEKSLRSMSLKIPPMDPGRYFIKLSLHERSSAYSAADTVQVSPVNTEIRVPGFRETLLKEFALRNELSDTSGIRSAIKDADFIKTEQIALNFNLRDSIPFLLIILLLLLSEWLLKKLWKLE